MALGSQIFALRDEALTLEVKSFHDINNIAISPSFAMLVAINEGERFS